jgi:hypothetical protein
MGELCWFVFIGVKTSLLYDHRETRSEVVGDVTKETDVSTRKSGEIYPKIIEKRLDTRSEQDSIRTSPYEILALALFTSSFALITTTFTALDMYSTTNRTRLKHRAGCQHNQPTQLIEMAGLEIRRRALSKELAHVNSEMSRLNLEIRVLGIEIPSALARSFPRVLVRGDPPY